MVNTSTLSKDASKPPNKSLVSVESLGTTSHKLPDAEHLFDLFLGRDVGSFTANEGGASSLLYHFATIIRLDLEYCERNSNGVLSLDLHPLYGDESTKKSQIRSYTDGSLIDDVFDSAEAVMLPPAIAVILVMFNRYHNYIANVIKLIKVGKKEVTKDAELYETARKIVIRLYRKIALHDFLPSVAASFGLEFNPLTDLKSYSLPVAQTPKGRISQAFRLESTISQSDEAWLQDFYGHSVFQKDIKNVKGSTTSDKLATLVTKDDIFEKRIKAYEMSIPGPNWRQFSGFKRKFGLLLAKGSYNYTYSNEELVSVLKTAIEQPAGTPIGKNVPKLLRGHVCSRINHARKNSVPKFNDFCKTYNYPVVENFVEFNNANNKHAASLYNSYVDKDNIEITPGLLLDRRGVQHTAPSLGTEAVQVPVLFHFIVTQTIKLARKDDDIYNASTLTPWGMKESEPDVKIHNGALFYRVIQRTLPDWFPYNSLYVMQPMISHRMNIKQAKLNGQLRFYNTQYDRRDKDMKGNTFDFGAPSNPGDRNGIPVLTFGWAKTVFEDKEHFHVPWAGKFNGMKPGLEVFDNYMLAGDGKENYDQRDAMIKAMSPIRKSGDIFQDYMVNKMKELLKKYSYTKGSKKEVDFIRDVAIPAQTYFLAELFSLKVKSDDWLPDGEDVMKLYENLLTIRVWGFTDFDKTKSWKRRNDAGDGVQFLQDTTLDVIKKIKSLSNPPKDLQTVRDIGIHMVLKLLEGGWSEKAVADVMWLTAVGSIGVLAGAVSDSLNFIFNSTDATLWSDVIKSAQKAANNNVSDANNALIRRYYLESMRLCSGQGALRKVVKDQRVWPFWPIPIPVNYKAGQNVVMALAIGINSKILPSFTFMRPAKFNKDGYNEKDYIILGHGQHTCLGKQVAILFGTSAFKVVAGMKDVKPAGLGLRKVNLGLPENYFLSENEDDLMFDPMTFKLEYSP